MVGPRIFVLHHRTYLRQQISQSPANQRSHGLGDEGLLVEGLVVGRPARDGAAAGQRGVAKEGARDGVIRRLAGGDLVDGSHAKGAGRAEEAGGEEEDQLGHGGAAASRE